jgi:hypothetical protein
MSVVVWTETKKATAEYSNSSWIVGPVQHSSGAYLKVGTDQKQDQHHVKYMFPHTSWEEFNAGQGTIRDFAWIASLSSRRPVVPFLSDSMTAFAQEHLLLLRQHIVYSISRLSGRIAILHSRLVKGTFNSSTSFTKKGTYHVRRKRRTPVTTRTLSLPPRYGIPAKKIGIV